MVKYSRWSCTCTWTDRCRQTSSQNMLLLAESRCLLHHKSWCLLVLLLLKLILMLPNFCSFSQVDAKPLSMEFWRWGLFNVQAARLADAAPWCWCWCWYQLLLTRSFEFLELSFVQVAWLAHAVILVKLMFYNVCSFFELGFVQVARLADGAEGGEAEQGREQGGQGGKLAGFWLL